MAVTRSAQATWRGNLLGGQRLSQLRPRAQRFRDLPVSWNARTADPEGLTGPEELLAAAHASCFSMALSNTLAKAGFTAEQLDVTATVTADKRDAGWTVSQQPPECARQGAGCGSGGVCRRPPRRPRMAVPSRARSRAMSN